MARIGLTTAPVAKAARGAHLNRTGGPGATQPRRALAWGSDKPGANSGVVVRESFRNRPRQDGAVRILDLQRAGAKPMKSQEFLRGTPLKPPLRLV